MMSWDSFKGKFGDTQNHENKANEIVSIAMNKIRQ